MGAELWASQDPSKRVTSQTAGAEDVPDSTHLDPSSKLRKSVTLGQMTDGGRGPLKIVRQTAMDKSFSKTHFLFLPMIGCD